MGGQPRTQTTTTTQDNAPWKEAQPYFLDLYKRAGTAMEQTNQNPFMGDFFAAVTPQGRQGIDALTGAVNSGRIGQGSGEFLDMATATARGDFLRPDSNPFLRDTVAAAIRPVEERLREGVLPAITDQAIAQGAYGGSGQDVSQERAVREFGRTAGNLATNAFMQNFMQERNNQLQAGNLLTQGYQLAREPGLDLLRIDEAARGLNQVGLENERAKFMEQKSAPWYGLGELAQILTAGGFRTTNTTQTAPTPNWRPAWMNWLQGGMGLASTAAGLGTAFPGMFPASWMQRPAVG